MYVNKFTYIFCKIPIEKSDFPTLIEVIFEADLILKDEKKGKKSILFHKITETTLIAIFEIRRITSNKKKKVSRIMLQTLYKKSLLLNKKIFKEGYIKNLTDVIMSYKPNYSRLKTTSVTCLYRNCNPTTELNLYSCPSIRY